MVAPIPVVPAVTAPVPVMIVPVPAVVPVAMTVPMTAPVPMAMTVTMPPVTGPLGSVETGTRFQRNGCGERRDSQHRHRREREGGGDGHASDRAPGAAVLWVVSAHRSYLVR